MSTDRLTGRRHAQAEHNDDLLDGAVVGSRLLRLRLLGDFSLRCNDQIIGVSATRIQSLLAYLALHRGPLPYPALQAMFDPLFPPGQQWYWRADFVNELSDEAIDLHIQHGSAVPNHLCGSHLYPINGAASRVGNNDTAWSYRDATWGHVMAGVDPDPANAGLIRDWSIAYWEALHPHSAGGAYVNMMMDEGVDRIKAAYRDNYDRLVAIKTKYDPNNLFHVNQNIKPNP